MRLETTFKVTVILILPDMRKRNANANVIGAYSYLDDTGYPKHVSYIADELGFRITNANNFSIDSNTSNFFKAISKAKYFF